MHGGRKSTEGERARREKERGGKKGGRMRGGMREVEEGEWFKC